MRAEAAVESGWQAVVGLGGGECASSSERICNSAGRRARRYEMGGRFGRWRALAEAVVAKVVAI